MISSSIYFDEFLVILVVDATGLAIQLSLFITAKHWPELVKECDKFDFYMKYYNFARYLKLKLYAVCVVLTVVALSKLYTTINFCLQ